MGTKSVTIQGVVHTEAGGNMRQQAHHRAVAVMQGKADTTRPPTFPYLFVVGELSTEL